MRFESGGVCSEWLSMLETSESLLPDELVLGLALGLPERLAVLMARASSSIDFMEVLFPFILDLF